ncbi:MAG: glycosyltransferase family 2 protein [Bacteroidota bacterium]|nr:glycosyltransferase family 2 protein [Bacteroidota bacterium]
MIQKIAILLTCHNRKEKTLTCLTSIYNCYIPAGYTFDIFLVDDGSTDGTANAVKDEFPFVKIIEGSGSLFWAGGMRLAWLEAINEGYNAYLLINDDVVLFDNALQLIIETHQYALKQFRIGGVYVSTTIDKETNTISYGGSIMRKSILGNRSKMVVPSDTPINCNLANANILFVNANVVEKIGVFDLKFKQSFADFDYSFTAFKNNLPVLVCPGIGGYCNNDHANNWSSAKSNLRKRIAYLYSPKGLEYKEYMYYIRKHFPMSLPYYYMMVWLKTFFPGVWDKFKRKQAFKTY